MSVNLFRLDMQLDLCLWRTDMSCLCELDLCVEARFVSL